MTLTRERQLDLGLVLALAVLVLAQADALSVTAVESGVSLLLLLAVALRRRLPLVATAGASGAALVHALIGDPLPPFGTFAALIICSYSIARYARGLIVGLSYLVLAVATVVVSAADPVTKLPVDLVYPLVYFGGSAAAGLVVRRRARGWHVAAAAAGSAVAEERARLARELHDVVAHSLSLVVVQAEAAEELLDRSPAQAREALHRIQETSRGALGEMRRLLGVLGPADSSLPQPSLQDLPALVAAFREAGLDVRLRCDESAAAASPGVQLTAVRVVQEALTNTLRHAGARQAEVAIGPCAGGLLPVEVLDDGTGGSSRVVGSGRGLSGLRERLALYDAELSSGPRTDGPGWVVSTALPVRG